MGVPAGSEFLDTITPQFIADLIAWGAIVATRGNPDCHVILRGSSDAPNYDAPSAARASAALEAAKLPPKLMIDCSHGNGGKDPPRQPAVVEDIAAQLRAGSTHLLGVMIESHLVGGRQELGSGALTYGQSITDACLFWKDTVPALEALALANRARTRARRV